LCVRVCTAFCISIYGSLGGGLQAHTYNSRVHGPLTVCTLDTLWVCSFPTL
jgi:hypothetical protein